MTLLQLRHILTQTAPIDFNFDRRGHLSWDLMNIYQSKLLTAYCSWKKSHHECVCWVYLVIWKSSLTTNVTIFKGSLSRISNSLWYQWWNYQSISNYPVSTTFVATTSDSGCCCSYLLKSIPWNKLSFRALIPKLLINPYISTHQLQFSWLSQLASILFLLLVPNNRAVNLIVIWKKKILCIIFTFINEKKVLQKLIFHFMKQGYAIFNQ